MRKILTAEERREFYKQVTEQLWKTMQSYPLQADLPKLHSDDYDGGRYDFYTTRGVK
jgi:hypothetical protein